MLDRIKGWFGFPKLVVTLDTRHADATRAAELAVNAFTYAADRLDEASKALDVIAGEALDLVTRYESQARDALAASQKNAERATRIRELLG